MEPRVVHPWDLTPKDAMQFQLELRRRLKPKKDFSTIRTVAGADVALAPVRRGSDLRAQREALAFAGVIVYSFPGLEEIERQSARRHITFPYLPGLLVFREGPALLDAFARLRATPDLLLFDAHGFAHPRRFGLACHLSVVLDTPGIGVAKSVLIGKYEPPADCPGAWTPLVDGEEVIGAALRTRVGVQPVFISIGHRVDLEAAVELALQCCDGYRVPKPTREADHFVAHLKRGEAEAGAGTAQAELF